MQSIREWTRDRTRDWLRNLSQTVGDWSSLSPDEDEPPLRAELFSTDQMAQHGKALAASHTLADGLAPDQLLSRLADNEDALIDVCKTLTDAVAAKRRVTPAGGWLLDNFYLIEEQIHTAKRHLPKGYSRGLPRLARGPSAGLPRVYDIALEVIAHGDGRVDADALSRFVTAYQSVTPLQLGELWAIPIMLRLAAIENLRRVGVRVAAGSMERELADRWADQMTATAEADPKSLILVIADMARSLPPLMGPFVAELARRLQGQGPALALPLTWIEQRLSESGQTIDQMVQGETQQQAANQVSVSNSIGSLRLLGAMDWRDFVESMSVVQQALLQDPAGIYRGMDFATRDRYRHATERIAKISPLSEGEVARKAVALAEAADSTRTRHVGYYLVDAGLAALEQAVHARPRAMQQLRRAAAQRPLLAYLGPVVVITLVLGVLLWQQALGHAAWVPMTAGYWLLVPIALLSLLAASQLGVALVNWGASLLVTPHPLPRMDFSEGIPQDCRTLVVVPCMLGSLQAVEDLVEGLEVRFLANRDACLHFGLLTDFLDADSETLPEDAALVRHARQRIDELNLKYPAADGVALFFLFHRPRSWNAQEKVWMGYERKRGKLAALNALLRGRDAAQAGFSCVAGDTSILSSVRYVITLDTDTRLPRDAAQQFVGAMAHPLNRAHYDPARRVVVEGYGILQPRVAISLPGSNRSRFARLYGSEAGIDPYTRAVSDVYQDVFGEGSFIGKGIYDVDAFEHALSGALPENRILSHDLLEGCIARSGLLSDAQLYEDFPARYSADVSRRHRWIRGDWQLFSWLLRRAPGVVNRATHSNPLSLLSQWKIFDNLRRSLVPQSLCLLLIAGWLLLPAAGAWTLLLLAIPLLPAACALVLELTRKPGEVLWRQHLSAVAQSTVRRVVQVAFELACLPYEAFYNTDAILRTLWRMTISHRRLLEWRPSSEVERVSHDDGLGASLRAMWISPVLAVAVFTAVALVNPGTVAVAAPILLLWLLSPAITWWVSRPLPHREAKLTQDQTRFLRELSRRTWAFFEHFVGPQDNWLPPDNVQEYRAVTIAHRTSPTNIGMALLANLSAHDFGYITTGLLLTRIDNTLLTMAALERHRGHFYNWYDTQTLQPLPPLYISTVDSGNLAGHLLTLRAGLLSLPDAPIVSPRLLDGIDDTFRILAEAKDVPDNLAPLQSTAFRNAMAAAHQAAPSDLRAVRQHLQLLATCAGQLAIHAAQAEQAGGSLQELLRSSNPATSGVAMKDSGLEWTQALSQQCHDALDELGFLAPWLLLAIPLPVLPEEQARLDAIPSLRELAQLDTQMCPAIARRIDEEKVVSKRLALVALNAAIAEGSARARGRIAAIDALSAQMTGFANLEYDFLFDKTRHLLAIGYNVADRRVDAGFYDLLASEARLSSFVAIAQGQLTQESWFSLGRLLTSAGGDPVLLSWSGSMFEYLMPMLVMPSYENSLLDQTCKAAVARQIEYGRQRGVPWGISESGYNTVDGQLNYQYRAFGVPGLGLKRGLAEDLVIAPYASVMALMVAPEAASLNLQRMAEEGFMGKYGFFEAIDYTPARQRRGQPRAVVHSFMAHHQGMGFLSLAALLLDRPMQRRFESDREFQAVLLLLQERIPRATALFAHTDQRFDADPSPDVAEVPIRIFTTPDTSVPEVQLLSNGRYHVMLTNAGGGYSRWKDMAVTRWREDATRDDWGSFCYIRETTAGSTAPAWSTAHQPTLIRPLAYEAIFSEGRAEFRRRDAVSGATGQSPDEDVFETHTEIVVSPEDDIELRRVRITNRSRIRREIEITSYVEVVIAPPDADSLHPAFSKLFVQTEILRERCAILGTRRPRSPGQHVPWMLHLMAVHGVECGTASFETDRARFIGRGRSIAAPQAMLPGARLSDSEGSVLDPVMAIRHRISLAPEQSVTIDIVTGMADTREGALGLVDKYQDRRLADRVFDLAWTHSQVVLRQLNATEADAQLNARLASAILYANGNMRAEAAVLIRNRRGQSGLWGYAISGDLPIVLLQVSDAANIDLVRQLVQAHAYWRMKGLAVDLVIWNEDHAGYRQQLQEQITGLIASGIEASVIDRPGGIFVRAAEQISGEDRILFQAVARAVIIDKRGSLADQLDRRSPAEPRLPPFVASRTARSDAADALQTNPVAATGDLVLGNGLGGFSRDGREYVITLAPGQTTPAPWVNVLANPNFGTVVSEAGVGYTWAENAHAFRLTPWHNDPVSDASGEALYLRDEESGQFWSPSPLPVRSAATCVVRHGFGYSVFEMNVSGIRSELWVYVALDASIKFSVLKLRNESGRPRSLSATAYVEWVLGDLRSRAAMHISTELAQQGGAIYARNAYSADFAERLAFLDVDTTVRSQTGDRAEFLGRNGSPRNPAAMYRARLGGKVGAGLDPCGAIQVGIELAEGQQREIVFRLGVGRNVEDTSQLVQRYRGSNGARMALDAVHAHWQETLGAVQVETPDAAINALANGWLVYQTLACRIWARSGYYQSGGAFGFRDQLQDAMALVHTRPEVLREHIVLSASRQFQEGDVQHWWHPPAGRGVRTHCSDDYLWLPMAVCRYVTSTDDISVLEEQAHFLEGRPVNPGDESYYDMPARSINQATVYEHCVRAIRHGLRFGEHGIPLMGSGDWNDGMNIVGQHGKGESVWLGFFLCEVLRLFGALAQRRGDDAIATLCVDEGTRLRRNIEAHAWDGEWYRRAWFDDGSVLGSASNEECRIDSISQSWSVLSGQHDGNDNPTRSRTAMQAVDRHLVRRDKGLVQLLDPPFDKSDQDPGYIRGYVPGVRENGGQYTHAAIWTTMAFARLGDRARTWELLSMINPVNHALNADAVATYKVEPYVVAADVYAREPHGGRGGWSWYTGSAGWMYRLVLESFLGLHRDGNTLHIKPCVPADWPSFRIDYRCQGRVYRITVTQVPATPAAPRETMRVTVDGVPSPDGSIVLADEPGSPATSPPQRHDVEVSLHV